MSVLALDTATAATAVALAQADGTGAIELRDQPAPGMRPSHAERLLELVAEVLARSEAGWPGVELIAVGVGPGTFTGLRIGIATAQGLAKARGLVLAGVPTLRALAQPALAEAQRRGAAHVLAALDARRGEVFAAGWGVAAGCPDPQSPFLDPVALAPADLAGRLSELGEPVLAVGDGAVKFRVELERAGVLIPTAGSELHAVSAVQYCRLASAYRARRPEDVQPAYLRLPDAELSLRRRLAT